MVSNVRATVTGSLAVPLWMGMWVVDDFCSFQWKSWELLVGGALEISVLLGSGCYFSPCLKWQWFFKDIVSGLYIFLAQESKIQRHVSMPYGNSIPSQGHFELLLSPSLEISDKSLGWCGGRKTCSHLRWSSGYSRQLQPWISSCQKNPAAVSTLHPGNSLQMRNYGQESERPHVLFLCLNLFFLKNGQAAK